MSSIFISYRRGDTSGNAGRLYDRLEQVFGKERVFMDVSGSIEPGTDFSQALETAVGSCRVLIVVIGPTWLTATGPDGERRLDDPADWLRLEVATALKRNIRVVPVLVDGAKMPKGDELPRELESLSRRQAIELSSTRWDYDVDTLVKILEKVLGESPGRWRKGAVVGGLVVLALLVGWLEWPRTPPPPPPPSPPPVAPPPKPEPQIVVPSLIGQRIDDAETRIRELFLKPFRIEKVSQNDPDQIVLSQNPAAGDQLPKDSEVRLTFATYPARTDEKNKVVEMIFCKQVEGPECLQPIFEDSVDISELPLREIEPGKPIRVIYFISITNLTDLVYLLHVWDRNLESATGGTQRCRSNHGDPAGDLQGGRDCLIIGMKAEPSPNYRHLSLRSVPGPGWYSVEVQDSDRWRLLGSKRRLLHVVDERAAF